MTYSQIVAELRNLSNEELRQLNHFIIDEAKFRRDSKDYKAKQQLQIGDVVEFQDNKKITYQMRIDTFTRKKVVGTCITGLATGMKCTVPAGLLTKVK